MSPTSLQEHRQVNDEICRAHGFSVLEPNDGQKKKKRLTPGEYRAAMRGESWKFRLIKAIDEDSMGKLASDAVRLGKSVEKMADVPLPLTPFTPDR
jgi:hypothetical protein